MPAAVTCYRRGKIIVIIDPFIGRVFMKLRIAALLFGFTFLLLGLAWYLPFLTNTEGLLLGVFQIDSLHNKVDLFSGLCGLLATSRTALAKLYFKIFGGLYVLLGIAGLIFQDEFLAMQVSTADDYLHLLIGASALLIGYKLKNLAKE
jgi:hypothetical protein